MIQRDKATHAEPSLRFDDPKYDHAMYLLVEKVIFGVIDVDPLLSQISRQSIQHSGPMRMIIDDEVLERPLEAIESSMVLDHEVIRHSDMEAITSELFLMAKEYVAALQKSLFSLLSEVTEATGNVITLQGRLPTFDDFIDMVERIDIGFDEAGNPIMPTIALNPKTFERLKHTANPTAQQMQRLVDVLTEKKLEHDAQKRTRRLSQ